LAKRKKRNEFLIIPVTLSAVRPDIENSVPSWHGLLSQAVRDVGELRRLLRLPDDTGLPRAADDFPLFVPRGYVARMRPGDPNDPLLLQVLPHRDELADVSGFVADPVGDNQATVVPGLLQKYRGRALLITTGACAVHCRYCFRRHFPYSSAPHSLAEWEPALARIGDDGSLDEVILSGGDPLMLVDDVLSRLAQRVAEIPHIRRLRVHTRLPLVLPERICRELLDWLCGTRLLTIMVVHANHPAEINSDVAKVLTRLLDAGVTVLNQSVLLRGVNDDADVLAELSRQLVELRVMPYYLHQLDRVRGAAHFEVSIETGLKLMAELRRRLPGYAVPLYVRETTGGESKEILA
jgi:EF-P beta-lysylation protein EpmB